MKPRFLLTAVVLCTTLTTVAQQRVYWRRDKVTQLIFPAEIAKFRTGYTSVDAVSQSDGRVLYIQPVDALPESNLNVITADGRYYMFDVVYDDAATTVNYIIEPSTAFYRETPEPAAPMPEPASSAPVVEEASGVPASASTARIGAVQGMPDYIQSNNVARLQKLAFVLRGVYADADRLYFKFRIENNANIPFDVDYIAFSVVARRTKKTSTQERMQVFPSESDKEVHRIDAKSRCEVIYAFDKFTIGKDKVLLAEVLESGGDRNIALSIPEHFIIEARKL
ncbi:MAG: DUF4138 domain-containing protein [Alistipes senegalensis]|nr:DUF4138 domain-containing protein [Bacteroides cellulosilyticus]MCM1351305.1 DUF4138 domain-containing protein [Alistipes senegalensis]